MEARLTATSARTLVGLYTDDESMVDGRSRSLLKRLGYVFELGDELHLTDEGMDAADKELTAMRLEAKEKKLPKPDYYSGRICFSIAYFKSEEDADRYAAWVRESGRTYNGGWFHGMPCGREPSRDFDHDELGRLYAVTE